MSTFYFSASGSDRATGTSELSPWRTTANLKMRIIENGDRLIFRQGDVFHLYEPITIVGRRGIVVSSSGPGRATLVAAGQNGIDIGDCDSVRIERLSLIHAERLQGSNSHGIVLRSARQASTDICVKSVNVVGFGAYGIFAVAERQGVGCRRVLIADSTTQGNRLGGVAFTSSELIARSASKLHYIVNDTSDTQDYSHRGIQIIRHKAFDNPGIAGHWTHSGSGLFIEDASGVQVRHSRAWNNGFACDSIIGGACGIWAANSRGVSFDRCVSSFNRTAGRLDGGGFDFDGGVSDSSITNCVAHSNMGAGIMLYNYRGAQYKFTNNVVSANLCVGNGAGSDYGDLHIGGSAAQSVVTDNVLVGCDSMSPLLVIADATSGIRCTDNVLRADRCGVAFAISGSHRALVFTRNKVVATGGEPTVNFNGTTVSSAHTFDQMWNLHERLHSRQRDEAGGI